MKQNSMLKLIIRLCSLLGKYFSLVLVATFNGTLGFILAMNITIFAGLAIMKFVNLFDGLSYEWIFSIIIVSGVLRGILRYVEQYFNHFIAFKILAFLRNKIFDKLRKISINKLDQKNKSEIVSIIQADVETLEIFYAHTISPFLIAILTCMATVIFISIFVHIYIGLMFILGYLIIGVLIPYIFYKFNKKYGTKYRQELAKSKMFIHESVYARNDIILNNNQSRQINIVNHATDNIIQNNKKLDFNGAIFRNITLITIIILNILVIVIGYVLSNNGIIVNYKILLTFITFISSFGSTIALASLPYNLANTFASAKRIFEILDEKEIDPNKGIKKFNFESLKFENVNFSYIDNKKVLKNVNIKIDKNKIVGILGESGCGKSTLLKLIMNFYQVDSGSVKINDRNINEYSINSLYDNINLFSQSTYLFKDTIWNNLILANPKASKQEVINVCKKVNIYDYIMKSTKKFDTPINELVDNLSTGEKQRIGLARVLLKNPKLLLLDEATSNIDALNEAEILNTLLSLKKDMSIIIVSHRLSTLSICDHIYKLKNNELKQLY